MKILLISTLALALVSSSCSRNINASKVPSVVVNALQAKYASATNVEWEKTKTGYEAELVLNNAEVSALIDPSGKILAQKWDVTSNDLPPAVLTFIAAQYNSYKIEDAEKLETNGAIYYQVELDKAAKKEVKLVLNTDGTVQQNLAFWD